MKIKKLRSRSASASLMIAISQIVGGGSLGIVFTASYIVARVARALSIAPPGSADVGSRLCLLAIFLSLAIIANGIRNCVVYGKYRKLARAIIARSGATTLQQIADETSGSSATKVLADIETTISRRYWSGYGVTENTLVIVDTANNDGTIIAAPDMAFREVRRRSRASLLYFAGVWVCALVFNVFSVWYGFIATAAVSIAVLGLTAGVLPRRIGIEQKPVIVREEVSEPVKTGVEETDGLLAEGTAYLNELTALAKTFENSKIGKPTGELAKIARQVFTHVEKAPEKSRQIRQFVKYYLPTTIKLLKNYDELCRQPVRGENISESIGKIEGIMDGILFTFRRQLDDLYRDKNIDISADIAVMENMISQDDVLSGK